MSSWGIFSSGNYAGTDQGVDFRGSGQIPALGPAVVTDVGHSSIVEGGTYPYVVYQLTGGPYKGHFVYVAENFSPDVHKGQQLRQGESVGRAKGSYPFIEIGFNKTAQGWDAVAPLGGVTYAGQAMKSFIYGLIGAAPPVTVPNTSATNPATGGATTSILPPGVPNPVSGVVGAAEGTVSFLGEITSAAFWLRALEVLGGGLLLIMGLYLLARQVGLAATAPSLPDPAEKAARDAERTATFSEPPGIDAHRPAYRRSTEGVKRDKVSHDVSEAGERQQKRRELSERAAPDFGDVPF